MRCKSIVIELEHTEKDSTALEGHATRFEFKDGRWETNGPTFPRFFTALVEVWRIIRREIDHQ
jgi:hypothetical protein